MHWNDSNTIGWDIFHLLRPFVYLFDAKLLYYVHIDKKNELWSYENLQEEAALRRIFRTSYLLRHYICCKRALIRLKLKMVYRWLLPFSHLHRHNSVRVCQLYHGTKDKSSQTKQQSLRKPES